jgi:cell division initiation protein
MIDLTPLEVRNKKGDFRRGIRGYEADLVDDFLDLVADRLEGLVKENMDLSDTVRTLEMELREFREKEEALSDALMAAQKLREDARRHAEKEGELLIREARLQAEDARQDVARSLAHEEETLRQVRARRAQLVASFRRLLQKEITELDVIEEELESGSPAPQRAARPGSGPDAAPAGPSAPEPGPEAEEERVAEATGEAEVEDAEGDRRPAAEPGDTPDEDAETETEQDDWLSSLVEE